MDLTIDQTKSNETSDYGEAVRLANELRSHSSRTRFGVRTPAFVGFDIETASYNTLKLWLENNINTVSQSKYMFVLRAVSVRFSENKADIKASLNVNDRNELELIYASKVNSIEWLGKVGYKSRLGT